jgi:hypothetical protein
VLSKVRQTSKYLLYALYTNVVFGTIYYLVFMWLVDYSLLYAYLGSLALIIMGLELDRYAERALTPARIMMELKKLKGKDRRLNYRVFQWFLDSFISFKTVLFVFYFLILGASQISNIDPTLVGKDLSAFILANNYGIVLLIAVDRIVGQFSRDRKGMEERSKGLKKALKEDPGLASSLLSGE